MMPPRNYREGSSIYNSINYQEHCFQSTLKHDSSSKPETDESHLVRDQDCIADGVRAPNQELLYGFPLPSPSMISHCHPTTKGQI
ncbi:hypothetical protein TNCV_1956381 [Trichonephila clavipes]|nr:hypothetical protein TNCV_1956381 [Trichonephila clavipes]